MSAVSIHTFFTPPPPDGGHLPHTRERLPV